MAPRRAVESRDFASHKSEYQAIYEIARRYKIMNPEKLRTNYGKLTYMLQDSIAPEVSGGRTARC